MKNPFLVMILAFFSFTLIACQSQNEKETTKDNLPDVPTSDSAEYGGNSINSIEATERKIINTEIHQSYTGDDSWIHTNPQLASYVNAPFAGEFKHEMDVFTNENGLIYYFKNTGNVSFTWKIFDPVGNVWASGTLNPGEFGAWEALRESIQIGVYKISLITSTGENGAFDFAAKMLE